MIKAVIFDFDDTLVETRAIKFEHHKAVAKKFYNIDLTEETFLKHYGQPFNTIIKAFYQDADTLENMIQANVSTREQFLKKLYPGSLDTVNTILDRGIKVGVLSATNTNFILDDFERFSFPINRFSMIQGPDETPVHKPDPAVFLPLLEKLGKEGIKKEETVYVGDSLLDLQAAHGAGIDFIAVTTGLYSEEDFKKNGAKIVVGEISEILKHI